MKVSQRAENIPASPIRKLVPFSNAAKKNGIHVYHLNIGQPDIETPVEMWDSIKSYDSKVLAYDQSNGLLEFRQGLVKYYAKHDIDVTEDEICVTTGGSEALYFALMVTTNPGDEVIVPEPFYANYLGFANYSGITVKPIITHAQDGFRLPSLDAFEEAITDKTKAILFSNPGNPTGVIYTREELETLAYLAKKHSLYLIADEVYREFTYDGETFTSIMHIKGIDDHVLLADSISKRYSACGARIGFLVSKNKAINDAIMKYAQARLCPPTLEQIGALGALNVPDNYFDAILTEYQARRDVVMDGVKNIDGAICRTPKGAFYCFVKLPVDDCDKFAQWLLTDFAIDNETVMLAPGSGFYATPNVGLDEARIAYVLNTDSLKKAMYILAEGVKEYNRINI